MKEENNSTNVLESLSISDTIGIENINEIFTIDPFYDVNHYNESLQALENNKVKYEEFILLRTPYSFYLRLENKIKPSMLNYENVTKSRWNSLLTKVRPLVPRDILKLYRFNKNLSSIKDYINNDAFNEALKSKRTIIFQYKNQEQLLNLSKTYGKIYILGKYINNRYRLAMCFDPNIKNVLFPKSILIDMKEHKLGELELEINNKILNNREKIIKWTQTPYFLNGVYNRTNPTSPIKI